MNGMPRYDSNYVLSTADDLERTANENDRALSGILVVLLIESAEMLRDYAESGAIENTNRLENVVRAEIAKEVNIGPLASRLLHRLDKPCGCVVQCGSEVEAGVVHNR